MNGGSFQENIGRGRRKKWIVGHGPARRADPAPRVRMDGMTGHRKNLSIIIYLTGCHVCHNVR